ncbi:MAG: hypothetical protein SGJ20_00095, partial [Planctomycetota bacterium]|nr:hypothetical protein [Planctomycetota bacterium]
MLTATNQRENQAVPGQYCMSQIDPTTSRATPEPIPDNLRSTQPGGGRCYEIELAWGKLRRWYLRKFHPAYVRRMAERMQGSLE